MGLRLHMAATTLAYIGGCMMDYTVSGISLTPRGTLSGTIALNSPDVKPDGTTVTVRYYDGPPEDLDFLDEVSAPIGDDLLVVGDYEDFMVRHYPARSLETYIADGSLCIRVRVDRSNIFSFVDAGCI
jgi:hypothetical protein